MTILIDCIAEISFPTQANTTYHYHQHLLQMKTNACLKFRLNTVSVHSGPLFTGSFAVLENEGAGGPSPSHNKHHAYTMALHHANLIKRGGTPKVKYYTEFYFHPQAHKFRRVIDIPEMIIFNTFVYLLLPRRNKKQHQMKCCLQSFLNEVVLVVGGVNVC